MVLPLNVQATPQVWASFDFSLSSPNTFHHLPCPFNS